MLPDCIGWSTWFWRRDTNFFPMEFLGTLNQSANGLWEKLKGKTITNFPKYFIGKVWWCPKTHTPFFFKRMAVSLSGPLTCTSAFYSESWWYYHEIDHASMVMSSSVKLMKKWPLNSWNRTDDAATIFNIATLLPDSLHFNRCDDSR